MAALKIATVCMMLLFVGSDLARPAICLASSPDDQEAAASALLQEVLERADTQKGSLLAEQHIGDCPICPPKCLACLIACPFVCGLNVTNCCIPNCVIGCFNQTLSVA